MTQLGTLFVAFGLIALGACSSSSTPPGDAGMDGAADATSDGAADGSADSGTVDAATDSATPSCPAGQETFQPGCGGGFGGYTPIEAGCYQPCTGMDDTSCGGGLVCTRTVVDPCVCAPGEPCCEACGGEQWVCLPPPPTDCESRSYCDCNAGCVPLVDLTTGCICPCNDPFNCTGETCDCVCGGATYLGCAPAGQCEETEVHCGSGCDLAMVDGCPTCDCAP